MIKITVTYAGCPFISVQWALEERIFRLWPRKIRLGEKYVETT